MKYLEGLSDVDKEGMVEGLTSVLESDGNTIVLTSSCVGIASAHDLLSEFMVEFSTKLQALTTDRRRTSRPLDVLQSNLMLGVTHNGTSINSVSSLEKLYDYYVSNVSTECAYLTLMFRRTETLDADILGDFIDLLKCSSLKIRLVFIHALSRPARFHLSQSFQSLVSLDFTPLHSMGSSDLYDAVVGRILASRNIPVSLPAEAIGWIHECFWRSERCVSTAVDRYE